MGLIVFYIFRICCCYLLLDIDELAGVVGNEACEELAGAKSPDEEKRALRKCFTALMNSTEESIATSLERFQLRIPLLSL